MNEQAKQPTIPLDEAGQPHLQALVERAGRRYAAAIGEQYIEDPFRRAKEAPHQGGYQHITAEEWAAWDRANAEWQPRRRRRVVSSADESIAQLPEPPPTPFEACATCGQEAHFGYLDKESRQLAWFCARHRLATWWADARR